MAVKSTSSTSQGRQITPSSLTLQNKLGLGILKLEGTSQAITASQADALLPLWKAVKVLNSSNITSTAEMVALYQQIESSLTSSQIQAIKDLSLTQNQLTYMIEQQNTSSSTSSSSSSSNSSSTTQSQSGGQGMDGGMMDGGSDIAAITGQTSTTSTTTQKTATVKSSSSSASQLNVVFANSVITLLQKRIS